MRKTQGEEFCASSETAWNSPHPDYLDAPPSHDRPGQCAPTRPACAKWRNDFLVFYNFLLTNTMGGLYCVLGHFVSTVGTLGFWRELSIGIYRLLSMKKLLLVI